MIENKLENNYCNHNMLVDYNTHHIILMGDMIDIKKMQSCPEPDHKALTAYYIG